MHIRYPVLTTSSCLKSTVLRKRYKIQDKCLVFSHNYSPFSIWKEIVPDRYTWQTQNQFCHSTFFLPPVSSFLNQPVAVGWMQHLKCAFLILVMISVSAASSILTTWEKVGLLLVSESQQQVMISDKTSKQSMGIVGQTPLLTTAKAACTAGHDIR